ncbi:uncharacterized protein VDAG_03165 [Verticillium dahliae VdLs.17]|uniref:Uncharacterized protein n=1 Tax=Verticillium dahliae (strain VdLs.17 / ATCC MYA-4575 / FGSC 10137) TaxID=498257 RepID=G2WYS3_VERDV|nr:uncharacterized protein VDAG_03165 [Verticillium dahliae VdLs.17]EGY21725.1 hypothetical protein VDAG_03165 [Verticillium dahliae VdLs.17]
MEKVSPLLVEEDPAACALNCCCCGCCAADADNAASDAAKSVCCRCLTFGWSVHSLPACLSVCLSVCPPDDASFDALGMESTVAALRMLGRWWRGICVVQCFACRGAVKPARPGM